MKKRVIGLMGNSGSGKSTVAAYFRQKGITVIDADEISHQLCESGAEGCVALMQEFEPYFFNEDGSLNRKRMGRVVFSDKAALKKLERILHPLIVKRVEGELATAKSDTVVIDCALLTQTGLDRLTDEIWLMRADENTKISRICERDGISAELAMKRISNQLAEAELMRESDVVIDNNGSLEQLILKVEGLLREEKKR